MKRIALPALAIGAVVLTGGAALGLGGIFAGGLAGAVGATGALGTILGAAGTGALIGAGGSLLTGGNILKGATRGFIGGAVTGGLSAVLAPAASAAGSAATTGGNIAGAAKTGAIQLGGAIEPTITQSTMQLAATTPKVGGLASALGGAKSAISTIGSAASGAASAVPEIVVTGTKAASMGLPVSAAAQTAQTLAGGPASQVSNPGAPVPGGIDAPAAGGSTGVPTGGIGQFLADNRYLIPSLLQGIGNGLSAKAEFDAAIMIDRARQSDREDNYNSDGFYGRQSGLAPTAGYGGYAAPIKRSRWLIDAMTGRPYREAMA